MFGMFMTAWWWVFCITLGVASVGALVYAAYDAIMYDEDWEPEEW